MIPAFSRFCLIVAALLVLAVPVQAGLGAAARTPISKEPWSPSTQPPPKVVYGADDRQDVYQVQDPMFQAWAASTCGLVEAWRLTPAAGGYSLSTGAYRVAGRPACADEPFGNQPTAAYCSGFLVGPDLIATAGHCYSSGDLSGTRFVFGFVMQNATTPVIFLEENRVYQGIEVVGRALQGDLDYAVIRLDRPVTAPGAIPFEIRREGVVPLTANVGVIGHPAGLPMKIAFGGATRVYENSNAGYFVANLDTYGGNSGSPVINPVTGKVEGILVRGAQDYVIEGNCFRSNWLPDSAASEDVSKTTSFAQFVPLLVNSRGSISLDRAAYTCSAQVVVTVSDMDLAGEGELLVTVASASGDEELLELLPTDFSGQFTAAVSLTEDSESLPGDGQLQVLDGAELRAIYEDANNGSGGSDAVEATALVDCVPPTLESFQIDPLNASQVALNLTANEATTFELALGLVCGQAADQVLFPVQTMHQLLLEGLYPGTEYFLHGTLRDEAGNETFLEQGGECPRFTTLPGTSFLTQEFGNVPFNLVNRQITFTPFSSGEGYSVCVRPATAFPVDPAGGTLLSILDDGSASIEFEEGPGFSFFGGQYESVYVNANGNLSFTTSDGSYDPVAEVHFGLPRISLLFGDLNPGAGGSIFYQNTPEKLTVTYEDVPQYGTSNSNNAQVELFSDGSIRITYLSVELHAGVTGLSRGLGVPSGYVSTNFALVPPCEIGGEGEGEGEGFPADMNKDWRITIGEVTTYGAAWKSGNEWTLPPNPIPVGFVTRAGYLWVQGEAYTDTGGSSPFRWVPDAAHSTRQALLSSSTVRTITGDIVTIRVSPASGVSAYAIEEHIPQGLHLKAMGAEGGWDNHHRKLKWGPYMDGQPRTFTYTLRGAAGSYAITGVQSFDGRIAETTGSTQMHLGADQSRWPLPGPAFQCNRMETARQQEAGNTMTWIFAFACLLALRRGIPGR